MRQHQIGLMALLLLGGLAPPGLRAAERPTPAAAEFFEKQVRPLLVGRCFRCHGAGKLKGGLKLTSRASLLEGGASGPAVVVGQPEESLLIQAVRYQDTPKMPPKKKLSEREIATLTRWVQMGVPWPEADRSNQAAAQNGPEYRITDEQRRFWSFQPVKAVTPPAVKDQSWPRSAIDRFILAGLEARGLKPARPADRRTLIRRATFDLIGLPPTPAEIDAFLADRSPDAFARVVDRLLASPQYGERWGRHWLDVVRYADSGDARSLGTPVDITEAYRYRDWVVDAFNRDLPYDRFVIDQIAGDLIPAQEPGGVNARGLVATGLLAIGEWGTGDADKEKMMTDIVNDQIDVVSRGFMGLTVACARCHDHKFDPIPTKDYYALAGIFFSTHILPAPGAKTEGSPLLRVPLATPAEIARFNHHRARVAELERQLRAAAEEQHQAIARALLPQTARYMVAAWEYENRSADQAGVSLAAFAARRGLYEYALRRWIDYLGLGPYRLMTRPIRDLDGHAGVHAWKGAADTPSLTVNTTSKAITIVTFTLPPRSVAVHPGPTNGVAIGWKSPLTGQVRISGRVADADPACGDGVAWILDQRAAGAVHELASGAIPNGGAQRFGPAAGAAGAGRLGSVTVKAGEMIQLLVLPRANHACDTTVVELTIAAADGSITWDLTRDLVEDPLQGGRGNPHADRYGHPGVWHFADMAESHRTDGSLAGWRRAVATADRGAIEAAAGAYQTTFHLADRRSPFWTDSRAADQLLPPAARAALARRAAELEAVKKNAPLAIAYALAAQEGGVPRSAHAGIHDARVHIRGSYQRLGDVVPRRFPRILAGANPPPITHGSGRLELARWLASPDHPLTARVMVNRIWQYHFGAGIVRTPSNFGKLGERPSHPELLDFLARQFVRSGWSVKAMHRAIMLSAAYQQSSEPSAEALKLDPDNRLFSRMNRRRLEAEEVRDTLLAVSGRLDRTMGGPATRDFANPRRTLYQMTIRSDRSGFGPLFDAADPNAMVDTRTVSTVAPQALFLLNHPFMLEQTRALARRIMAEGPGADLGRIGMAYVLLYGRPPTAEEVQIGLEFLARARRAAGGGAAGWEEYCQVLLCTNELIAID